MVAHQQENEFGKIDDISQSVRRLAMLRAYFKTNTGRGNGVILIPSSW